MSRRGWALARAGVLTLAAALLSPVDALVLVAVPAALMLLAFRRESPAGLAAAALVLAVAFRGVTGAPTPLWLAERGWALVLGGAFVGITVVRGGWSLTARSLTATTAAAAATGLAGWIRPGLLPELDWWVRRDLTGAALAARQWLPDAVWGPADGWALVAARGWQEALYPALMGLASLAALSVGWYVVERLSGRDRTLGPFRDFRFTDRLAWALIAGLGLLLAPGGEAATRIGENLVVFVGGLYLLRGLAILYCVVARATDSAWSAALWVAAGVLLYPLALAAALLLGLGDTWMDLRGRLPGALAEGRTRRP